MINVKGNRVAIVIFAAPALLLFTLVVIYPTLQTLFKSLYEWDGLNAGTFIGIENFKKLFGDQLFYRSTWNGLKFALVQVIFQIGFGSWLAFMVAGLPEKRQRFFTISYFLPVVLSAVIICQLWNFILEPESGLLNTVFKMLKLPMHQTLLIQKNTSIYTIGFVSAWQYVGYEFLLLLTAIKAIPEQYQEAARIDGANVWQIRWNIYVPLLGESYKNFFIMSICGGITSFTQMYILTGGGPGTQNYSLTFMMFRYAFTYREYGYGCAVAALLLAQCLTVTILANQLIARERINY